MAPSLPIKINETVCVANWERQARAASHPPPGQEQRRRAAGSAIEILCRNQSAPSLILFLAESPPEAPPGEIRHRSRPRIFEFLRRQQTPPTLSEFHSPCVFAPGADHSAAAGRAVPVPR